MKMRWFLAGLAALLITGGGATIAQRVITQKTRGVLPAKDDSAHPETRPATQQVELVREAPAVATPPPAPRLEPAVELPLLAADEPPPPASIAPAPRAVIATTAVVADHPPVAPDQGPPQADPAVSPTTAAPEPSAPTPGPVAAPAEIPSPPVAAPPPAPAIPADPVASVETFVERNRKEAETAIDTLTAEAANLKERLAKVETALGRWQSFARALNVEQPAPAAEPTPAPKANWKRGTPEVAADPAQALPPAESSGHLREIPPPAAEATPGDASSDPLRTVPPANPPLSLPADVPEARPSTPEPTGKPPALPPAEPAALPPG